MQHKEYDSNYIWLCISFCRGQIKTAKPSSTKFAFEDLGIKLNQNYNTLQQILSHKNSIEMQFQLFFVITPGIE